MTAAEFNAAIGAVINTVFVEGVRAGKCDPAQIIGILEIQKQDVIRWLHESAKPKIVSANVLPINPNGTPR